MGYKLLGRVARGDFGLSVCLSRSVCDCEDDEAYERRSDYQGKYPSMSSRGILLADLLTSKNFSEW